MLTGVLLVAVCACALLVVVQLYVTLRRSMARDLGVIDEITCKEVEGASDITLDLVDVDRRRVRVTLDVRHARKLSDDLMVVSARVMPSRVASFEATPVP